MHSPPQNKTQTKQETIGQRKVRALNGPSDNLPFLPQRWSVPTPQRHALSHPPGSLPDLLRWRQKPSVSLAVYLAPQTNKKFSWEKEGVWKLRIPPSFFIHSRKTSYNQVTVIIQICSNFKSGFHPTCLVVRQQGLGSSGLHISAGSVLG